MDIGEFFTPTERPKAVCFFSTLFALLYHAAMLFVFLYLQVYPMFFFNIASVTIFTIILFSIKHIENYLLPYFSSSAEVILHQIAADYFLGTDASFHFFILIMVFLPFLIYVEKPKLAVLLAFFPMICFVVCEALGNSIEPASIVPSKTIFIIKIVNISLTVIVFTVMALIFSFIVYHIESNLESEVKAQTEKLQKQTERIINIQKNTIFSLANLVENRDSDTGEHVRRTSAYAYLLGKASRDAGYCKNTLTDEYLDLLYRAAPMHDVGKIVITDLILKKPGKLSFQEYEQMKKHTIEGGRIIHEVFETSADEEYVKLATEIAKYHHEHWDGRGYPDGLSGEQIPLSARIMALADVFDALVSKRCYKQPYTVDEAFEIIGDSSNSHFDPRLTFIFIENKSEICKIMEKYKD